MKVIWLPRAENGKARVADYIRTEFGAKRQRKFAQEVDKTAKMLQHHPNLGAIDPLFADRPIAYRSIIIGSMSKMVYRVDNDIIHIVAFWDCRQDPEYHASQV